MTTPDKCPKCGAETLESQSYLWSCGRDKLVPEDTKLCLMTQRAQRAEARAEKWKEAAINYRGLTDEFPLHSPAASRLASFIDAQMKRLSDDEKKEP